MKAVPADSGVGDAIPALVLPPVTRHLLALYCGASGDHNPLHTDIDFARHAGLPDVIAHGMLLMALLGRVLTQWIPQDRLRRYAVRFVGQVTIGDVVTCTGVIDAIEERDGERRAQLRVEGRKQNGDVALTGHAEVAL